jgi:hypothetical protein
MAKDKMNQTSADRTTRREKPVIVERIVEMGLGMLSPEERDTILHAIRSWTQLRKLERTADVYGSAGDLSVADVSTNMRIVFRVTPEKAEVLDLVNKGWFQ